MNLITEFQEKKAEINRTERIKKFKKQLNISTLLVVDRKKVDRNSIRV